MILTQKMETQSQREENNYWDPYQRGHAVTSTQEHWRMDDVEYCVFILTVTLLNRDRFHWLLVIIPSYLVVSNVLRQGFRTDIRYQMSIILGRLLLCQSGKIRSPIRSRIRICIARTLKFKRIGVRRITHWIGMMTATVICVTGMKTVTITSFIRKCCLRPSIIRVMFDLNH